MEQAQLLTKLGGENPISIQERLTLSNFEEFLQFIDQTWFGEEEASKTTSLFSKDYFPDIFSQDIGIDSLEFTPSSRDQPLSLSFIISWEDASVSLIKNVLELEECSIGISVTGKHLEAIMSGVFKLEDYEIQVQVELPSLLTKAQLRVNQDQQPEERNPLSILKKYSVSLQKSPTQSKVPRLTHLLLLAAPLDKRFILDLAVQDIQLGKLNLGIDLELAYQNSEISGFFSTDFEITLADGRKILFLLSGAYDGPGTGLQLEGGVNLAGVNLHDLYEALKKKFGITSGELPQALQEGKRTAEVKYLYLSFNTQTKAFTFSCTLDFHQLLVTGQTPGKNDVELTIDLHVSTFEEEGESKQQITAAGKVVFLLSEEVNSPPDQSPTELEFDLVFDKNSTDTTLAAAYQDLGGGAINIGNLIQLLNPDSPDIPISVDLKQAYLIFIKEASGSNYLIGADIGAGINLSALPLVGKLLPAGQNLNLNLQAYHSKAEMKSDELAIFQSLLPGDGINLPEVIPSEKTTGVAVNLLLGDEPIRLSLPIDFGPGENEKPPAAKSGPTPAPDGEATGNANAEATVEDKTRWIPLNKNLGPIQLERIGMQFQQGAAGYVMLFQMDGALSMAGLTLSLDGLAAQVSMHPLKKGNFPAPKIEPVFMLRGLGLDFQKGPLEIGGSFLRSTEPAYDEYDGMVTIGFEQFNLTAIGSYARVNGHTSLFIYLLVDYPLGGPPFFFMTGLAGAFGYNRALRLPPVEKMKEFPLVAQAMKASQGNAAMPGSDDRKSFLTDTMTSLRDDIPPQVGEYFFGVGIKFNSFKLLDSFLLLAVSFGRHLEIDVVGLSRLQCPAAVEGESEESTPPVFVAELAIKASIIPDEGFVGVKAVLTSESYLLSPDCHLTGGFAFYTWLSGDHAGDFVLTIGGYHPDFPVPRHYPTVPRLGFNWNVTPELHLEGGAYFALTAHALMAGAALKAVYQSGDIKAWFDAGADFLISWQPYYYEADLHLDIGIDVTLHIFGTQHISLDLGADLNVWGPEFSGTATIHVAIISFTVAFGSGKAAPIPISWEDFQKAFIPEAEKVCSIGIAKGLVKKVDGDVPRNIVNPKDLEIWVNTTVPITTTNVELTGREIGMGPMGISVGSEVVSNLVITLNRISEDGSKEQVPPDDLDIKPVKKRAPAAIWGGKIKPDLNDPNFIGDALMGFSISAHRKPALHTKSVSKDPLGFSPTELPDAISFETESLRAKRLDEDQLRDALLSSTAQTTRSTIIEDLKDYLPPVAVQLDASLVESFTTGKTPKVVRY